MQKDCEAGDLRLFKRAPTPISELFIAHVTPENGSRATDLAYQILI